ncbi:Rib/alpha-like domain-containing protein, partial [Streptococcus suis]
MKKKSTINWYHQKQRFSLRKYHFGAASVLLGTALVFGGAQVSAEEVTTTGTPENTTLIAGETGSGEEGAQASESATPATEESVSVAPAAAPVATQPVAENTSTTGEVVYLLSKDGLEGAIASAKSQDLSTKTSDSVAVLLAAIEHAETVLATATSQGEIDQAQADLEAAEAQLAEQVAEAQPMMMTRAAATATGSPVANTSTATISTVNGHYLATTVTWEVTTKLDAPAKAGDYVDYTFEGVPAIVLNGVEVTLADGTSIGTISTVVVNDERANAASDNPSIRDSAKLGSVSGTLRVTFNENVEHFSNIEFKFGSNKTDVPHSGTTQSWTLTSLISNEDGVIASTTTNIMGAPLQDLAGNPSTYMVPQYVTLQSDGTYRGEYAAPISTADTNPLQAGDLLVYTVNPTSASRIDTSKLQVGDSIVLTNIAATDINGNNVFVSADKSLRIRVKEINAEQTTFEVIDAPTGDAAYMLGVPAIITDMSGYDAVNKTISATTTTATIIRDSNILNTYSTDGQNRTAFEISGIVTDTTAVVVPRADVYVQYVDESGNLIPGTTKTLLLDDEKYGTAYTATGLDATQFPNYAFVKMADGSAPESGTVSTGDLTVTYVYRYVTEAERFTPTGQDVPAKVGDTPKAEDGISNKGDLPAGTTYEWKDEPDTTTPGDKPATVVVTYPDGSKDEVPVTVKVTAQSDDYTPTGQDV